MSAFITHFLWNAATVTVNDGDPGTNPDAEKFNRWLNTIVNDGGTILCVVPLVEPGKAWVYVSVSERLYRRWSADAERAVRSHPLTEI